MNETQLSRWGAYGRSVDVSGPNGVNVPMAPNAKYFFVGKTTLPSYADFQQEFKGYDADGGNRIFPSLAAMIADANVVASRGDVIYILPGHTETISSSTALSLSVAGITIVSLGIGGLRATFTLDTATSATINVTANNVSFQNCIFIANFAAIVACFTLTTAKDFQLLNCEFRDTTSILNFVSIVTTDTTSNHADGLTMIGSKRIGAGATTNTTIANPLGTNDRWVITDNYFAHAAVTGGGAIIIATGKILTNIVYRRNIHNFVGATSLTTGLLITTDGTTNSGVIADNYDQNLDATTEILVTASSGFIFFNNYHSAVADKSGYLLPAADA